VGATDLAAKLQRKPFEPFRIITSDGVTYDVRHPDIIMVSPTSAVIGYPDAMRPRLVLAYDIVALEHITRLEELPQPAGKPTGNGAETS